MKVLPLSRRRDVALLQMMAYAFGARASGEAFEMLVDQLHEARRRHEQVVERFVAEMEALRAELTEERAKRAQLQVLAEWPSDRVSVQ